MMTKWRSAIPFLAAILMAGLVPASGVWAQGSVPVSSLQASPAGGAAILHEEQRARDKAEIQLEVLKANDSWFSILIATSIALFGVLITGTVIFFSLRFGNQAVEEAKRIAKEEFELGKSAIDEDVNKARELLAEVEQLASEIRGKRDEAHALLRDMKPEDPKDEEDIRRIAEAAEIAEAKPRIRRSADDYRALILQAFDEEDWPAAIRRSRAMAYLYEQNSPADGCWALFALGVALGKQGKLDEEVAAYDEVVAKFGGSHDPAMRDQIGKVLINKATALSKQGRSAEEIAVYDEIIARFGTNTSPEQREQLIVGLVNKGAALIQLGRPHEAIAAWEAVISRFGQVNEPGLREHVDWALFNWACTAARAGDVEAAMVKLREWAGRLGHFDCAMVRQEEDFAVLRDNERFRAFLQEMGC